MDSEDRRAVEDLLSRGTTARFGRRGRKSIYEAPEFTKRLSAFTEAHAGDDVKFECQYKGFPRPTLRWYRDDELVQGDERYVYEECDGYSCLSITKVGKNDEAAYKCKAENSEGVTSTTGYLSVTGDLSDKPLSCQGRQSEHAVSNPPPLRTIIEQKSMEEREEDEYPQPSTSPVDEILEEAALKGQGWPAMLGFKKKREKRQRQPNEEDYDSGSDTSVESQQDGRVGRERTPDADLVIDEDNLLPYDAPLQPEGGEMKPMDENTNLTALPQDFVTNGEGTVEQPVNGTVNQDQQMDTEMQQGSLVQTPDVIQINPMEVNSVNQAPQVTGMCQCHEQTSGGEGQVSHPDHQHSNNGYEFQSLPDYSELAENIVPEIQTAPAMVSPTDIQMEQSQPQLDFVQPDMVQDVQMSQASTEPQQAMQMAMVPDEKHFAQVQDGGMDVSQPELGQPEMAQETQQFTQLQEGMLPESQPEVMQTELAPSSEGISEGPKDESLTQTYTPDTEKQKSIESGYSTEDIDAAVQQEAAATFTETMEIPVVRGAQNEQQNEQQAMIFLGDSEQTTPEVQIGSPVNLHVSLTGSPGQAGELPIGIQLQGMHPLVLEQGNVTTEPDGVVQQPPLEVVAQPVLASPQVYESPANFVSLECAEVRHSPPRLEQQEPQTQVQYVSSVSSEITEPQVLPQSTETVMTQPVEQSESREMTEEEILQYSSASNPFRTSGEDTNEEILASYTRTFSSTIEEEENAQEVGEPLTSAAEPIVRHTDEIITLATVETRRPYHDWLPFPWLPVCLLVTVSTFIAVAFEINPSTFVLVLFLLSLISFRFLVSKVKPKED